MTHNTVPLTTSGQLRRCIEYLRHRQGWNQTQLAAAVGRSQQWVSRLENGNSEVTLGDVLNAMTALEARTALRDADSPRKHRHEHAHA